MSSSPAASQTTVWPLREGARGVDSAFFAFAARTGPCSAATHSCSATCSSSSRARGSTGSAAACSAARHKRAPAGPSAGKWRSKSTAPSRLATSTQLTPPRGCINQARRGAFRQAGPPDFRDFLTLPAACRPPLACARRSSCATASAARRAGAPGPAGRAIMAQALRRVGLSWWRDGLGGGVVPAAPESEGRNEADLARVAALTEHFTRIVALDPSRPAVLRGPRMQPSNRASEFQYRGPDLTRTLPPDLKARGGGCGAARLRARARARALAATQCAPLRAAR